MPAVHTVTELALKQPAPMRTAGDAVAEASPPVAAASYASCDKDGAFSGSKGSKVAPIPLEAMLTVPELESEIRSLAAEIGIVLPAWSRPE